MQVDTAALARQMHGTLKQWTSEKAELAEARAGTSEETLFLIDVARGGAEAASEFASCVLDECLPDPPELSDDWRMPEQLLPSVQALEDEAAWVFIVDFFAIVNGLYQFMIYETDEFERLWGRYIYVLDWLGHPAAELAAIAPELLVGDDGKAFWLDVGLGLQLALIAICEPTDSEREALVESMDPEITGPHGPSGWLASRSATAIIGLDRRRRGLE